MKIRYYLCILPLLASCTGQLLDEGNEIELFGVISNSFDTRTAVKAKAYKETIPSTDAPLAADIWFSTTSGKYLDTGDLNSHRTITYYGPSVTNPSADAQGHFLHYPTDGTTVYCVGMCPLQSWTTDDGTTASATIDGVKDLMFAAQKAGNNSSPLSSTPQQYNHLLTWVKIRVRSVSHETVETWGHIKKITISSANRATVNLGSGDVSYTGKTDIIAFEGDEIMPIMSTEFGNVMVSPAEALPDGQRYFSVSIECDNHKRENIQVKLSDNEGGKFTGDTTGKVFVLTLYFKTLDSIGLTTTLSSWEDEGRVIELD